MGTPRRKWYPGAIYHITARGNHKNDIFRDEEDFQVYLALAKEAKKYYEESKYEIICYCLMTNHVHLLIRTGELPIGKIIGRINSMYAKYFNNKYNYVGHLFQDRFYSKIIEDDKQMLEASRYIHLNPVRANMVKKPEEYMWSSYEMYIGSKIEKLVSSEKILCYFKKEKRRELYKRFVESSIQIKSCEEDVI